MSEQKRMCVMIPVHKPQPTADELISLQACRRHLAEYDCYLVHPAGMDTRAYIAAHHALILKPVDPDWLSSIERYNKMKLSLSFYDLFAAYNYMLTYELDAFIFSADLEQANAFKFDYIGAPFFEGYWAAVPGAPFIKGGNSGFSVRNVQACITVLRSMGKFKLRWMLYKIFLSNLPSLKLRLNRLTKYKYEVFISGSFGFYFADFHLNEDVVWSEIVPQLFPTFTIADPLSALKFSFEYNLNDSLRLNNGELPLGCHAWFKHLDFWKKFIDTEKLN
jgi:hypothetical protein